MRRTLLSTTLFALTCYGLFFGYTYSVMQKEKEMLIENQNKNLSIAYEAVTQMYRISIENYFQSSIMKPSILSILHQAKFADEKTKAPLRGSLYRLLYPLYHDTLLPFGIRQFHFHTILGESFLRFHAPTENGDPLADIRPSIKQANINKKTIIGFEGGRIYPGFRYVFPIIDKNNEHLGSVELSLPYDSIERELLKLLPYKNAILLFKKSITTDLVFKEHLKYFSPSSLSNDFVIENSKLSKSSAQALTSPLVQKINTLLLKDTSFETALDTGKNFSLLMIDSTGEGYIASFHAILDISNQFAGYAITYGVSPEYSELQKKYFILFAFGSIVISLLVSAVYVLLVQRKRIFFEKMQFETIIKKTANGIILTDSKGLITFINHAGCTILGYKPHELLGAVAHARIHVHDTLNEEEECHIMESIRLQRTYVAEETFRTKEGKHIIVNLTSTPFILDSQHTGTVIIFRNITQEKKDQELIQHLAYYDNLTDLPNRKLLLDRLAYTMSMSNRILEYCGLLFIDIDNFKNLNDTKGHDIGDMLLISVAKRLKETVRISDTVARFGGDEFVILVTKLGTDEQHAKAELKNLGEKLLHALSQEYIFKVNNQPFSYHCTASIGGTTFLDTSKTINQVLKDSDMAMYEVKKNGKNEICIL